MTGKHLGIKCAADQCIGEGVDVYMGFCPACWSDMLEQKRRIPKPEIATRPEKEIVTHKTIITVYPPRRPWLTVMKLAWAVAVTIAAAVSLWRGIR